METTVIDTHTSATVIDSNRPKNQLGIDYHHPLYLHASDAPSSMSIGIPLVGMENYSIWREAMQLSLLTRNKLGFVDGSISRGTYGPAGGMDPTALFTARGSNNKPKKYGVECDFCHAEGNASTAIPATSITSPMFTHEQYTRLLGLLNTEGEQNVSAYMAGISSHTSEVNPNWIIDTGATNHMVGNSHLLIDGTEVGNTGKVQLPNGEHEFFLHLNSPDHIPPSTPSIPALPELPNTSNFPFTESSSVSVDTQPSTDLQSTSTLPSSEVVYFLGIEFARRAEGIVMHQRKYTLDLISDLGLSGAKPANSPLELHEKLTSTELDCLIDTKDDHLLIDISSYQRLIGRLLYLTHTRPDISFAVQTLSQFMHSPKLSHMAAATRVVRYLKKSPGLGIFLSSDCDSTLTAFCDADWASCSNTRRSVTGYMIKFGSSPVSWKSKKQSTISRSSAEAEYRSLASTVAEIVWLVGLFTALNVKIPLPVKSFACLA
uniref:Retrotransposon Copia-like N-terminal domain-containing protein n=1 Tax=Solanum lycopersicum TaxID=4081 RepID=A0A3Q7I7W9_SOLLC